MASSSMDLTEVGNAINALIDVASSERFGIEKIEVIPNVHERGGFKVVLRDAAGKPFKYAAYGRMSYEIDAY